MIVGQNSPFYIDNSTALENVYRLNVGGNYISPSQDTGLYRSWGDDLPYIYGAAFGVAYSVRTQVSSSILQAFLVLLHHWMFTPLPDQWGRIPISILLSI